VAPPRISRLIGSRKCSRATSLHPSRNGA
jgi:hypothetical protein